MGCLYIYSKMNISAGIVRVEQKNNTLLEMGVYDDGPYEVGDEHLLNPELVPVPANSYLGECLPQDRCSCICGATCILLVQSCTALWLLPLEVTALLTKQC